MGAVIDKSTSPGNRGSHYNKGADFLYFVNESPAQIWRQPVNPATLIVQQAARPLGAGQSLNLNSLGVTDLRWTGGTTKQLVAQNGAKVAKLTGATLFDLITPEDLEGAAPWDTLPANNIVTGEDGLSPGGNFYAVRIPVSGGDPHYAKVRIFNEGTTRVEWFSYISGTRPSVLHVLGTEVTAPRDLHVNETETEIYVSGGIDEAGYVYKYNRIIGGSFPQYSLFPTPLHDPSSSTPLLSPRQMVVDGASVYVVAEGGLFLLQSELGSQTQVQVVSGISAPVGLLIDRQGSTVTAYISTTAGQIYVVDISEFTAPIFDPETGLPTTPPSQTIPATGPSAQYALEGPSGFLTWADDAHTAFYATVLGASGKIQRIDLVSKSLGSELTALDPTLADPWSVEVFTESSLSVVCDAAIYDIERGVVITSELALGLGLIPFDFINKSKENPLEPEPTDGRCDTSSTIATSPPGYYFAAYPNLAFGGSISLLINHDAAYASGLRYYRVSLTSDATGRVRTIANAFTDLRWNSMLSPPRFEGVSIGAQSGLFPVRRPDDLWYNPYLAAIINTGVDDNGHNRLKLEFFDANKAPVAGASYTRLVFLDNTRSSVSLSHLRRGTPTQAPAADAFQAPEACGLIAYTSKDDLIEIDFTAVHPLGGKCSVSFARGSSTVFTVSRDMTPDAEKQSVKDRSTGVPLRIGHLTGNCDIANITVSVSAPAPRVINGHGWVNLGSQIHRSFTLANSTTHTPWPLVPPQPLRLENRPAIVMGPPVPKK